MDADNSITVSGDGPDFENGVDRCSEANQNGNSIIEGLEQGFESAVVVNHIETAGSTGQEVTHESTTTVESNASTSSEGYEAKDSGDSKNTKHQKVSGKAKNSKTSSPKDTSVSGGKRSKAGSVDSNGTLGAKSKSFNDRKTADNNPKVKQSGHAKAPSGSATRSEDLKENTKVKPLKKVPPQKVDGRAESLSPTAADANPRKVGTLPSYNFSFKCNERAERRKEFYSKLEEKIHEKEVEKSNLQAKTKENQEAELKMLRKNLNFKATPMPNFYQEPTPPKELKKIPPTRAKSPKLGRRKSSPTKDQDNESASMYSGRLSLDENASRNNPAKIHSSVNAMKPQRKSLPKLPSEKTNLPNEKKKSSHKSNLIKEMSQVASQPKTLLEQTNAQAETIEGEH